MKKVWSDYIDFGSARPRDMVSTNIKENNDFSSPGDPEAATADDDPSAEHFMRLADSLTEEEIKSMEAYVRKFSFPPPAEIKGRLMEVISCSEKQLTKLQSRLEDVTSASQTISSPPNSSIPGNFSLPPQAMQDIAVEIDTIRIVHDQIARELHTIMTNIENESAKTELLEVPGHQRRYAWSPAAVISFIQSAFADVKELQPNCATIRDPSAGSGCLLLSVPAGTIPTPVPSSLMMDVYLTLLESGIRRRVRQLTKKAARVHGIIKAYYRSYWKSPFVNTHRCYIGFYPMKVIPSDGKQEDDLINVLITKIKSHLSNLKILVLWAQKKWSYY